MKFNWIILVMLFTISACWVAQESDPKLDNKNFNPTIDQQQRIQPEPSTTNKRGEKELKAEEKKEKEKRKEEKRETKKAEKMVKKTKNPRIIKKRSRKKGIERT